MQYCGKEFDARSLNQVISGKQTTITVKQINGKKLDTKKNYKLYIEAYQWRDGKKHILAKTMMFHVAGKDHAKYTNAKAVRAKKDAYTLKTGESVTLRAGLDLYDADKEPLPVGHARALRYKSSNDKVATVGKNGKVSAKGAGSCTIYVIAVNGRKAKIAVTVEE